MKAIALSAALLVAFASSIPREATAQPIADVNPHAATLKEFHDRISAYMDVRKRAAREARPVKQTTDPSEIQAAKLELAEAIRAARPNAKPGDIFTPAIRAEFRRLLYPELKGEDGNDVKEILKDDAPGSVPLKVNAKYPEKAALPTVPAKLLLNLPTLPAQVEYRIIGKHLILRDTDADIILDYIPNAIQ